MMHVYNIYEAKAQLSRLVKKALEGEEIVIARAGEPLIVLVPYEPKKKAKRYGLLKGKIRIGDDFDTYSPEVQEMFREYEPDEDERTAESTES